MKFKKPNHIGIVVKDVDEAKERYGRLLGIKNWYKLTSTDLNLYYNNARRECEVTLLYGGKGATKLELIGTTGDDNIYTSFLEKRGEGIHHVMYNVKDLDKAIEHFSKEGYKVLQHATFKSAGNSMRYAYVGRSEYDCVIELVETTIFFGLKKGEMPMEVRLGLLLGSFKKY